MKIEGIGNFEWVSEAPVGRLRVNHTCDLSIKLPLYLYILLALKGVTSQQEGGRCFGEFRCPKCRLSLLLLQ